MQTLIHILAVIGGLSLLVSLSVVILAYWIYLKDDTPPKYWKFGTDNEEFYN